MRITGLMEADCRVGVIRYLKKNKHLIAHQQIMAFGHGYAEALHDGE